jgi:hypothetical protein
MYESRRGLIKVRSLNFTRDTEVTLETPVKITEFRARF